MPYTKISSKWIKNLNVKPETTKFLVENVSSKLLNIGLGNFFLSECKNNGNKSKNKQIGLHHTKKASPQQRRPSTKSKGRKWAKTRINISQKKTYKWQTSI